MRSRLPLRRIFVQVAGTSSVRMSAERRDFVFCFGFDIFLDIVPQDPVTHRSSGQSSHCHCLSVFNAKIFDISRTMWCLRVSLHWLTATATVERVFSKTFIGLTVVKELRDVSLSETVLFIGGEKSSIWISGTRRFVDVEDFPWSSSFAWCLYVNRDLKWRLPKIILRSCAFHT